VILLPGAVRVYFRDGADETCDGALTACRTRCARCWAATQLNGHVFVFLNRRKTQVKLLLWTRGGFTIVHKRWKRAIRFSATVTSQAACVALDVHELGMLLEGIDMSRVRISRGVGSSHALDCGVNGRRAE